MTRRVFCLYEYRWLGFLCATLLVPVAPGQAQAPLQPYATIDRDAVSYMGPGRDARHDLAGPEIKIGLLVPLTGPRQEEGKALLSAAQLALEDEAANSSLDGRRLVLSIRDDSGPWGRASNEIVRLVFEETTVALITSVDGGTAHLAEQIGNKIGVPILTFSSDSTTTQINLPWIFRLGPTDRAEAHAFAESIYHERGLTRVVLVTESDHDGRVGGEVFEKAAKELTAPQPYRVVIDPALQNTDSIDQEIEAQKPEALVFWTEPQTAIKLLARVRGAAPSAQIFLCQKAAQALNEEPARGDCRSCSAHLAATFRSGVHASQSSESPSPPVKGGVWTVTPGNRENTERERFRQRYLERFGQLPSLAAAQAYDAVRIVAGTLRRSGPNRARLRDSLAGLANFSGVSGALGFDPAGNNLAKVTLVRID